MGAKASGTGVGSLIVVDTDIFIDHFRGVQSASDYLRSIPGDQRATTDISVMELLKGASSIREVDLIERFLARNRFVMLPVMTTASRQAVQLLKQYSLSQGLSIPDALIAGNCAGVGSVTSDREHKTFSVHTGSSGRESTVSVRLR